MKPSEELDVLFVNAGIADLRPVERWDEAAFDRSIAINLKGPFFLIQALLPIFSNPASIVLNASVNAHIGMPNTSVYGAAKAALLSLTRTLSGELISRGIRVNAVSPVRSRQPFTASSACQMPISKPCLLQLKVKFRPDASEIPVKSPMRLYFLPPMNLHLPSEANS